MSSPIPSTSGRDPQEAPQHRSVPSPSVLALSGLLRVQRRWQSASGLGPELSSAVPPTYDSEPTDPPCAQPPSATCIESPTTVEPPQSDQETDLGTRVRRPDAPSRPAVHLEDSEWSRLALGIAAEVLESLGMPATVEVLQLGPDDVTVHLPTSEPAQWPFVPSRAPQSWTLPRDSRMIASLHVTPAITSGARAAALVTLSESDGRRTLVNLVGVGSTVLEGAPAGVGVTIAEVAVELASRRWSDLETLILVGFDPAMPRLHGARYAPDVAAALDELTVRSMNGMPSPSTCVVVPPWASDPADPILTELIGFCEATDGAGILCCATTAGAMCLWELAPDPAGVSTLTFGDGRRLSASHPCDREAGAGASLSPRMPASAAGSKATPAARTATAPAPPATRSAPPATHPAPPATPRSPPIEVAVLGTVQVNGAPESFRHRRRLTELVAYLAMHPEGSTTDAFATALWPDRRVPLQTLANRLSEARRALGFATDGRPRLRKRSSRHLIAEAETDWDRFRDLASEGCGADSWRRALALVRGRPFDGLDRGEWAHLEGFSATMEASVVSVACRLGDHSIGRGRPDLAHWAGLQGLLVSPWDERLYRLLMRAADGLGNRGGIDAALRSLARALELEGDPLVGIHPETSALYRSLISGKGT